MTTRRSLAALEQRDSFVHRHIGASAADTQAMLAEIGHSSLQDMMEAALPPAIRARTAMELPPAQPEHAGLAELRRIAARNRVSRSFIGQGYYGTVTPEVIKRNVLENPAWYTAYTPYQAEISQGRLEALLNFQQMIIDLTGMDIANASLLDEATAAAEAMALTLRARPSAGLRFHVADDVLPQTIEVLQTRAHPLGVEIHLGPAAAAEGSGCFGLLLQFPGANGAVSDYRSLVERLRAEGAMVVVAADLLALTLLAPPGEWGADVVVGTTQRFGVPLGYGGPHAGYLATRDALKRQLPGRLVGVTVDAYGNPALRLALQTREQHIRREKATSNICTAQVLPAILASMYAVYHGPEALRTIAARIHRLTATLAEGVRRLGIAIENECCFDTLTLATGDRSAEIHTRAAALGMNLRQAAPDRIGISLDELATRDDVIALWALLAPAQAPALAFDEVEAAVTDAYPAVLKRQSAYLSHPVFNTYHAEHEMLRYLRRLADRDLALDRTMIPLGSCTMKLNAAAEMEPITWPEFADIHPFAPADQTAGYRDLIAQLDSRLCAITGYAAVSFQPNAGSQGEYAGLLMIKAYHAARGEAARDVCLIPVSAHGTNPASARMAGMQVVEVACDEQGCVDLSDLAAKAAAHATRLAAIMITYPSTHGVFEPGVQTICELVHAHGGQVYVDGANLNALVGWCAPGAFGGDVSHLNLHKTFCIPHGGGGPGVGALAVAAHLAPFLPNHRAGGLCARAEGVGAVSAAAHGSAGILPVPWLYIRLMGRDGLTAATAHAVLAANYIARRLAPHYPVLYTGPSGHVAHECIVDLRHFKDSAGIVCEDVAKRLIDYGFHAPTMSFPVPGTLMIEPTESESKAEIDRFIEAMIAIRAELRLIESGHYPRDDNPLIHAPHPAEALVAEHWPHPYTRAQAAYPVATLRQQKYWPPIGRADNVYGDRNLKCSLAALGAPRVGTQGYSA